MFTWTYRWIVEQRNDSVEDSKHVYEIGARKDKRGVDLISDALPFGKLWYGGANAASNAVGYAKFYSRSHDAVISLFDENGDLVETRQQTGDFKEP